MKSVFYTKFSNLHFLEKDGKKSVLKFFDHKEYDIVFKKYTSNQCFGIRSILIYLTENFSEDILWEKYKLNSSLLSQIRKIQFYTNVSNDNYELIPNDILLDFGLEYLSLISNSFLEIKNDYQSISYKALENFDRVRIILEKLSNTHPFLLRNDEIQKKYGDYIYTIGGFNFLRVNYSQNAANGLITSYNRSLSNISAEDPIREILVSRFGNNGSIIQLDYNAFHPRIIFSLSNYNLSNKNDFYSDLIKELKIEQISRNDLKTLLFQMLYGYSTIKAFQEKFEKIFLLKNELQQQYEKNHFITSITGRRKYLKSSEIKTKILNSYIQMTHSEIINEMLCKISVFLNKKRTKLIGIISDSFLFDVHSSEKDELKEFVLNNLQQTSYLPNCFLKLSVKDGKSWAQCTN